MSPTGKSSIAHHKSLSELFDPALSLKIPHYQRPYTWSEEQVKELLNDILGAHRDKPNDQYMMGTIIVCPDHHYKRQLQEENNSDDSSESLPILEIVDGQQRLTTLTLLIHCLDPTFTGGLMDQEYLHQTSQTHLLTNHKYIMDWLARKGKKADLALLNFVKENLVFALVTAPTQDEAFVFFDSQNTRGKELSIYDRLKAHHLRFIANHTVARSCAVQWEQLDQRKHFLNTIVGTMLGRSRKWMRGVRGYPNLMYEFKAQRTHPVGTTDYTLNRYHQPPVFESWRYQSPEEGEEGVGLELTLRSVDIQLGTKKVKFLAGSKEFMPFQIGQALEGGEQFFWYVEKYAKLYQELYEGPNSPELTPFRKLHQFLKSYDWNTGIGYVVEVFEAAMLFYYDKFGSRQINEVALWMEHALFYLRHRQAAVRTSSIPKFLVGSYNPFAHINQAAFPDHIIRKAQRACEDFYQNPEELNPKNLKGVRKWFLLGLYGSNGYFRKETFPCKLPKSKEALLQITMD